jgi:hypothetical protein
VIRNGVDMLLLRVPLFDCDCGSGVCEATALSIVLEWRNGVCSDDAMTAWLEEPREKVTTLDVNNCVCACVCVCLCVRVCVCMCMCVCVCVWLMP